MGAVVEGVVSRVVLTGRVADAEMRGVKNACLSAGSGTAPCLPPRLVPNARLRTPQICSQVHARIAERCAQSAGTFLQAALCSFEYTEHATEHEMLDKNR